MYYTGSADYLLSRHTVNFGQRTSSLDAQFSFQMQWRSSSAYCETILVDTCLVHKKVVSNLSCHFLISLFHIRDPCIVGT